MPSLLIDRFLPAPMLREVDHQAVAASPDHAWRVARALDLARLPLVRWLFELRILPDRIAASLRGADQPQMTSIGVDSIAKSQAGFMLLGEERGREVVVGAIGRFWQPRIEFASVEPDAFAAYSLPGWGKVAWNIRVDPRAAGGSWLTVDLRVGATDRAAADRFRPYWMLIGRFSRAIRAIALREMRRELGTPPRARIAGDDLLPNAIFQRTHRTFIEASPAKVWPWLVQMGCRRAGWYSVDLLDNAGVRSADHVIPALQKLDVGDLLPARPRGEDGFAVLQIERERALVLGSPALLPGGTNPPGFKYDMTWAFTLEPVGPAATELIVRVRAQYQPSLQTELMGLGLLAAHEIMQTQQLRNLKARVERA